MSKPRAIAAADDQQPHSVSRLLDSNTGIPGDDDNWGSDYASCESCHWAVLETRPFKGRELCLACIAEYFDPDADEV
jgi:hypothetical protein